MGTQNNNYFSKGFSEKEKTKGKNKNKRN